MKLILSGIEQANQMAHPVRLESPPRILRQGCIHMVRFWPPSSPGRKLERVYGLIATFSRRRYVSDCVGESLDGLHVSAIFPAF